MLGKDREKTVLVSSQSSSVEGKPNMREIVVPQTQVLKPDTAYFQSNSAYLQPAGRQVLTFYATNQQKIHSPIPPEHSEKEVRQVAPHRVKMETQSAMKNSLLPSSVPL